MEFFWLSFTNILTLGTLIILYTLIPHLKDRRVVPILVNCCENEMHKYMETAWSVYSIEYYVSYR